MDHAAAKLPSIPKELVGQFLTGPMTEQAINAAGLAVKQALIEASLAAELTHHLGYAPGAGRAPNTATDPDRFNRHRCWRHRGLPVLPQQRGVRGRHDHQF